MTYRGTRSGVPPTTRTGAERRQHPRHPVHPVLGGKPIVLSLPGTGKGRRADLSGQLQNISAGGLCLLSDQGVELHQVLRSQIPFPELAVAIPTLLYVRWIHRPTGSHAYRLGLQFVV